MITKHALEKQLLFDGAEHELAGNALPVPANTSLEAPIRLEELAGNKFEELEALIGTEDFEALVQSGDFTVHESFLNGYKGTDELKLYYARQGKTILVFALGEFQPTRYKLYFEGAWEVK